MKKATVVLALISAILATGLVMSVLGTTPVFAATSSSSSSSTNTASGSAGFATDDFASSSGGAGGFVHCGGLSGPFVSGAECIATR